MSNILTFFSLTLTQIGVYLYLKNSLKDFIENFIQNYSIDKKSTEVKIQKIEAQKKIKPKTITYEVEDNNHVILNKTLRHLEFISQFEMYLEEKHYKNFSIEFLQEFEKIKHEAQITTIKTTNKLNCQGSIAA
ncbi:hypothetical protein [Winogradskyella algicola]|uniref:hypothetical protein n=1 Tax=Winogradskyella algicola TaxID=2575815 RepID=UPI001109EDC8|nr:hypothetical protein [Winogradskyella algicola]